MTISGFKVKSKIGLASPVVNAVGTIRISFRVCSQELYETVQGFPESHQTSRLIGLLTLQVEQPC